MRLETRPYVEEATVGEVLPEALTHASHRRLEPLSIALEPTTKRTLRTIIEREPEMIGEILAPSIGAAVKRAIADVIAAMQQRFDQALERSLSIESLRWRIEARRTGRPFAEVVLLHSLIYRVEQVFAIHSESGLLLEHVADPASGPIAPDQVAAMLSAIDAFVRDTFRPAPAGTHLRKVDVGDRTIWVEHDGILTIAAFVRGEAPATFAGALREARERLRVTHADELASFHHDVSAFASARPVLERLLQKAQREPRRRARVWFAVAGLVLVVLLGGVITAQASKRWSAEVKREAYARVLGREPGIVVTSVRETDDGYLVTGFRDPLARAPAEVLSRRALAPADLRFASFLSLDPRLTERRIERALRPPRSVRLALSADGTLRASGTAPRAWIERARFAAPALVGVERYVGAVRPQEAEALERAAGELEELEIRFARGSARRVDREALALAASRAERVLALAEDAGASACIDVMGHTAGTVPRNVALSGARARAVAAALADRGVSADRLRARGAGRRTGWPTPSARAVVFSVEEREAGSPCGVS